MTKDEYNKFKVELEKICKDKEFTSSFKEILKFVTTVPVNTVKRMEMDILMKRYIDMTYKYCCDFAKDKING